MTENQKLFIVTGLIVASILFLGRKKIKTEVTEMTNSITSRGIRNNNPGNIRVSTDAWQGLADPKSDGAFFRFTTPEYGIRALAKVLMNYNKAGYNTIEKIISRWAPRTENDTDAYIYAVSSALGKKSTEKLNFQTDLPGLVAAIIQHENGNNPYPMESIGIGISMAYV